VKNLIKLPLYEKKVLLSPTEPLLKWQRVTLTLLFVNNITGVLMKIQGSLY